MLKTSDTLESGSEICADVRGFKSGFQGPRLAKLLPTWHKAEPLLGPSFPSLLRIYLNFLSPLAWESSSSSKSSLWGPRGIQASFPSSPPTRWAWWVSLPLEGNFSILLSHLNLLINNYFPEEASEKVMRVAITGRLGPFPLAFILNESPWS